MTVDLLVVGLSGYDLLQYLGISADDAREVHHLCQTLDPGVVVEGIDGAVIQDGTALIHGGGGDTGGQHEPHIHRQPLGGLEHVLNTVSAHDIGNLVGVTDDGSGAVGQYGFDEFTGGDHGALQMDMSIDKAGQYDLAGHIYFLLAGVGTHTHDQPLRHGNVTVTDLVAEHIDIGGIFQHQISLLPSGGHLHDPQLFVELSVDFAGIALSCHAEPSFLHQIMVEPSPEGTAGLFLSYSSLHRNKRFFYSIIILP